MNTDEHHRQILENQRHWESKRVLHGVYREFHRLLAKNLATVPGETLELGSGIGNIRETIPNCVRTDLFKNPWIDRCEDAYRLSMPDKSVANLILFDVFHHLEFPIAALHECHRVLVPGGRLLVFDHAMSVSGFLVSKFAHHERGGFAKPYSIANSPPTAVKNLAYYADHANAHRILVCRFDDLLGEDWRRIRVIRIPALKWLLSGGYRGPSILPILPSKAVDAADRIASLFPKFSALRLLAVLEPK